MSLKFAYQARSKEGKIESGTVEATSKEAAASLLQKYNVTVISLKEIKPSKPILGVGLLAKKVRKKDLAVFSRELAVMIEARVPVVQCLLSLAAQTAKPVFKEALIKVSELVEEGNPLSDAFSFFPKIFNAFYINLIRSGEASGKISESLYYLGDHLEREDDINSKLKEAMIYPALVLALMIGVGIIVMVVIMPKLVEMMQTLGSNVPPSTKMMIGFYQFLNHYGWILMLVFIAMVIFLVYYLRGPEGKKTYDKSILRIPFLGSFFQKVFLMRFAENLSTLISSGLPITQALKITKNTIDNHVYMMIIAETEKNVSEGEKISSVLVKYPDQVPLFVIQMIKVGEETGKLDKTLMEIVNFYKKEVDTAVSTFTTLIEPILIIVMGVGVALIAASVLEPLYGVLGSI